MSRNKQSLAYRFWTRVCVTGQRGPCWEWTGGKFSAGYGIIRDSEGVQRSTHRIAFELVHGKIPDGMWVCHKCDNPGCVNPDHLFLGTAKDNTQDAIKKGRFALTNLPRYTPGETHPAAHLTQKEVDEIRARYNNEKTSHRRLASEFGVSHTQIRRVVNEESWRILTLSPHPHEISLEGRH